MQSAELVRNYPDFFVSEIHEDVLWLRFSGNFFHNLISFDKRDFLGDYFTRVRRAETIRTVVFQTNYSDSGVDEYVRFFLANTDEIGGFGQLSHYELHRLVNIINQTIVDIINLNKFTIQICQGTALNIFMNIGFACDYRLISEDAVFYSAYKDIGGLPLAGGAWFLTRLVGRGKAHELLLLHDQIDAETALACGLVNRVTPRQDLESAAMATARRISAIHPRTVSGVKKLTSFPIEALKEYLVFETNELLRVCVEMRHDREHR